MSFVVINKVSEKTADVFEAGSNSNFYYQAYTNLGQVCDLGLLDLPDYNDRQRGQLVFPQKVSEFQEMQFSKATKRKPSLKLSYRWTYMLVQKWCFFRKK